MIQQPDGLCDLENPKNWRTRTSIHVKMGETDIQVDAAQEFRLQAIHNRIPAIDIFILTHGHADHILGMDDLRRFCDMRGGSALPVYSTQEGLERIRTIFPYAIRDKALEKGYPAFDLREMPSTLKVPGGLIHSTPLPHGSIDVLGLVFESGEKRIAYFTDCSAITDEALELSRGADLVVLDGLRQRPHRSHMSLDQAVEAAGRIQAKISYLTHMTCTVDHDTVSAELPEGVHLAYDGLRVEV